MDFEDTIAAIIGVAFGIAGGVIGYQAFGLGAAIFFALIAGGIGTAFLGGIAVLLINDEVAQGVTLFILAITAVVFFWNFTF